MTHRLMALAQTLRHRWVMFWIRRKFRARCEERRRGIARAREMTPERYDAVYFEAMDRDD